MPVQPQFGAQSIFNCAVCQVLPMWTSIEVNKSQERACRLFGLLFDCYRANGRSWNLSWMLLLIYFTWILKHPQVWLSMVFKHWSKKTVIETENKKARLEPTISSSVNAFHAMTIQTMKVLGCSLIKFRPLDQQPGAQYTILLMLSVLEFRCTENLARVRLRVTRPHA